MKDKLVYIIIGIAIVIIAVFTTIMVLKNVKRNKKIENITYLRLSYTGGYAMYAYTIYTIELIDGKYVVTVKPYGEPDENIRTTELSKEKIKELEKTLTNLKVAGWNGFNESDKYVLDGDSFSFSLKYGDNEEVSAHGYMRWPENYSNVKSYIIELINTIRD
jgi:hypothetical protein